MSEIKSYSREEYVFLSRLYEKAEKYQLMFKCINKFIELDPKLSKEERNILGSGYKNIVSDKRSSLRILYNIEKRNIYQASYIKEVKENIEKELSQILSEIQYFLIQIIMYTVLLYIIRQIARLKMLKAIFYTIVHYLQQQAIQTGLY